MTETDERGEQRSYLATEENFRILAEMERNNAIVPITGDFAGPKAIRSVGRYLKSRGATVNAIYTSNVEQYLFQQDDAWKRYYANVAALPIDGRSDVHPIDLEPGLSAAGPRIRLPGPDAPLLSRRPAGEPSTAARSPAYYDVISMSN